MSFNTLRPRQDGRLVPDDIFKSIFFNENVQISIKISLTFVPEAPINNITALVQIMAWRRPATSHYLNQWWLVYWRIYASFGLNELNISQNNLGNQKMIQVTQYSTMDGPVDDPWIWAYSQHCKTAVTPVH